jgi:tetrahydromethanopterin S-methyltransferase subunit B
MMTGMSDLREPLERDVAEIKEVLRRLEPMLVSMHEDIAVLKARIDLLPTRDMLSDIKARVELLPSVWTMAGLVIGIFMLALVLVRFGIPH